MSMDESFAFLGGQSGNLEIIRLPNAQLPVASRHKVAYLHFPLADKLHTTITIQAVFPLLFLTSTKAVGILLFAGNTSKGRNGKKWSKPKSVITPLHSQVILNPPGRESDRGAALSTASRDQHGKAFPVLVHFR